MTAGDQENPAIVETAWLQLLSEDVVITKQRRPDETVRVTSETRTRDVTVDEPLLQETVVVERVPVGRYVDAVPPVREEGDTTIMPVVEEEVVVTRRLFLREEVRLQRLRTTTRHVETVSVREQVAHVSRFPGEPISRGTVADTRADPARSTRPRSMTMDEETIVAVYDTPAHADAAVQDLRAANVPESAISRHHGGAAGMSGMTGGATTTSATMAGTQEKGFWSSLFGSDSDTTHTDATVYDRSMQGGSSVVVVKGTPAHDIEAIMAILERHNPIDIDERAATYGVGSTTAGMTAGTMGATSTARTGTMETGTMTTGTMTTGTMSAGTMSAGTGALADDGRLQLSEEQIAIGKRVINRGGTRIRRYVVETPVEENVTLHSEKVTLERRPVTDGRPVTDSFSEKTIEMTETAEEVVVSKTARVVEEVGLRKEATDRVETIRDTVRKEEVEVEQIPGTATTTSSTTTPTRTVSGTTPKV